MIRNVLIVILLLGAVGATVWLTHGGSFSLVSFGEGKMVSPLGKPLLLASVDEVEQLKLKNDLEAQVTALGQSDNVSLYYKNLNKNYEIAINADRSWVPASMVKAYVVVEAYRQKEAGLVNFDQRILIKIENVVPTELEAPDYQPLRAGVRATVRELVYAMVVQSDNTAFNTLIDVLDRRNISSSLKRLGLTDTVVGEKLSLNGDQYELDSAATGRQSNRTTVRDFGRLFIMLYEGKISQSEEILAIFKKQKFHDMLPALLPADVVVAHKTGTFAPYYHDGGIIYKPNEPFVLVVFTNSGNPSAVAQLSKVAYYKSRDVLGASTTSFYGRILEMIDRLLPTKPSLPLRIFQ